MAKSICGLGNKKPSICKSFPQTKVEVKDFPFCSFYWENGKRKGRCNRCGECCVNMRFDGVKYDVCPYLEMLDG